MKLYVPEIGDKLELTKDWKFDLYYEYRNAGLFEALGKVPEDSNRRIYWDNANKSVKVAFLKGVILIVDRIYVRKGKDEFSSLSFRIQLPDSLKKDEKVKKIDKKRFWAKLKHCNNIEFELLPETKEVKKKKAEKKIQQSVSVGSNVHHIGDNGNFKNKKMNGFDVNDLESLKFRPFTVELITGNQNTFYLNDSEYQMPESFVRCFHLHYPGMIANQANNLHPKLKVKYQYCINDIEIDASSILQDERTYSFNMDMSYLVYDGNQKLAEFKDMGKMLDWAKEYYLKLEKGSK
jgi:hypothetical protein